MRPDPIHRALCVALLALRALLLTASAETTISPTNRYACGGNTGWIEFRGDGSNGVAVGEYYCTGCAYSANCGWIMLGRAAPTNGVRHGNAASNDFGVNVDSAGNLRGLAYGANIGWVKFESNGSPRVDFLSGNLSGYAYGANVGWFSLSNAVAIVQTLTLAAPSDADRDGLPDAWEIAKTGYLNILRGAHDADQDGQTDLSEYIAGTDPTDPTDLFKFTAVDETDPSRLDLSWRSAENRLYALESRGTLTPPPAWIPVQALPLRPDSGARTTRSLDSASSSQRLIRVRALLPMSAP